MKNRNFLFLLIFIFLFLIAVINTKTILAQVTPPTPPFPSAPPDPTRRLIVKFKPTIPKEQKEQIKKEFKATLKERIAKLDLEVVDIAKEKNIGDVISALSKDSRIEFIEPDFIATKVIIPNDSLYPQQWGLKKIQSEGAWNTTQGNTNVDIAILDTGIDDSHPDLAGKIATRANFTTDPDIDGDGHGTHVAGIAAASTNNNLGIAGLGFNSRLISVKVLDNSGSGYYSWVTNGIIWASDNGAEVINLSLGGNSSSTTLRDAIRYAWNKGVVITAAAGNSNNRRALYPAYYNESIAVAATDQNDKKASFSSYGTWVDVAAPGVNIISTTGGDYQTWSGTSMATPYVAGVAGLVKSLHPDWSNSQIRNKIESSADKIAKTGSYWVHGRINACKAVDCIQTLESSPSPSPTSIPSASPTPSPTPSLTPSPSPSPSSKPWWCSRIPTHSSCQ